MATSRIKLNNVIPTNINFQSILYAAMFLSLLVLSVGLILFIASLNLFTKKIAVNSIANASSGAASVLVPSTKSSILGLNIANNGLVLLRSAQVVSISGDKKINVVLSWGSTKFNWTLETDNSTEFFDSKGKKVLPTDVHTGDLVTATGGLSGDGAEPIIKAEFIRIL